MFGMALTGPSSIMQLMSRMCGAKGRRFERLLWQYSATWRETVFFTWQFLSNVSRYLDCFFWILTQFHTSDFRKVVRQYTEGVLCWEILHGFAVNFLGFPAVKEFWKSVKNWQSYCHEFDVQLFWSSLYIPPVFNAAQGVPVWISQNWEN